MNLGPRLLNQLGQYLPLQKMQLMRSGKSQKNGWKKNEDSAENSPPKSTRASPTMTLYSAKGFFRKMSLILLNVRSMLIGTQCFHLFVLSSTFDISLFTETWLNDNAPGKVITISGYEAFRKIRNTQRGGGWLFYFRESIPNSLYPHPILNTIQHAFRVRAKMGDKHLPLWCVHRHLFLA